jgi:hypothetical protein
VSADGHASASPYGAAAAAPSAGALIIYFFARLLDMVRHPLIKLAVYFVARMLPSYGLIIVASRPSKLRCVHH